MRLIRLEMLDWAYQWKMSFILNELNKCKRLYFREYPIRLFIQLFTLTMYLLILRLHRTISAFSQMANCHLTNMLTTISNATKGIEIYCALKPILPHRIIYKSFKRTHLCYGYVVYDQLSNASFSSQAESV